MFIFITAIVNLKCLIDDVSYDITCLQKSPNDQTAPVTKCTLVYDKKPSNLIFWDISRKWNMKCYVEKCKMYKLSIQIHTLLPGGKSPWYSKDHAKCKQFTWSTSLRNNRRIKIVFSKTRSQWHRPVFVISWRFRVGLKSTHLQWL